MVPACCTCSFNFICVALYLGAQFILTECVLMMSCVQHRISDLYIIIVRDSWLRHYRGYNCEGFVAASLPWISL